VIQNYEICTILSSSVLRAIINSDPLTLGRLIISSMHINSRTGNTQEKIKSHL
jgi:hypothetical protein